MITRYSKLFRLIHFLGDLLLVNFAFLIAFQLRFEEATMDEFLGDKYIMLIIVINLFWIISASFLNIYDLYRVINLEKIITNLIKAILLHALLIGILIVALKGHYYSRKFLLFFYWFYSVLIILFRLMFLLFIRRIQAEGFNTRNTIIVGAGQVGIDVMNLLINKDEYGYKILGFFDDRSLNDIYGHSYLGKILDIENYSKSKKIDEIFCALPLSEVEKIRTLKSFADNNLIRFKIVPDFRGFYNRQVSLEFYGNMPIMRIRPEPLENPFNAFLKRLFDIVFSFFVIVFLLSWLIPLMAFIIKFDSKGPVFFIQKRSGERNKIFSCLKLRTMQINDHADVKQAVKNDPRITKVGKFMRKTNIDELPQFINVFMGHMSIVGPRPHMLKHTEDYSKVIDKFMVRHFIKPGITGLAQVGGYRGETSDPDMMHKRVRADVWYIENWTFLLDIKIIIQTVINMFKGDKNAI